MKAFITSLTLGVAALSLTGCNPEDPLMRMYRQKKARPYSQNSTFADGRSMRMPPEGAVSRERILKLEEAMPAMTAELLAKGKKRYDIVCATCHGLTGESDWSAHGVKEAGSMVATNFALNPAPSWHQDRLRQKPDEYYYNAIVKGFGYMPAFTEIPQEERWAIVGYIRALQLSQRYSFDKLSEAERSQVNAPAGHEHEQHQEKEGHL